MNHPRSLFFAALALALSPSASAQFPPAPGTGSGLPETIEAIESARVTTRILYVTAHPDDESGAVLTYLARGLHADVALLSLTRGEGGQNALGPEQAPQLGLIRTQELLAATRGYGVKLYFTRAKDFGYSKTPEETQKVWGDAVLEDMVRVIREFRPNIIINGWGGVHSGHGHHQTAGLWTSKAAQLAADPKFLPDHGASSWDADGSGIRILDVDRGSNSPKGYLLPLDEVSSLYGKSWREIGLDAFANHRTQGIAGFLNSPFLLRPIGLFPEDGSTLDPSILNKGLVDLAWPGGCETSSKLCEALKLADRELLEARKAALNLEWPMAVEFLEQASKHIEEVIPRTDTPNPRAYLLQENATLALLRIHNALKLAAGFDLSAQSESPDALLGEPIKFTLSSRCRQEIHCTVSGRVFTPLYSRNLGEIKGDIRNGIPFELTLTKEDTSREDTVSPVPDIDSAAKVCATATLQDASDFKFADCTPIVSVQSSSVKAARVPLRIIPAYTIAVEPTQAIEVLSSTRKSFDVFLRVHSYSAKPATVTVGLDVPGGMQTGDPAEVHFDGVGDQYARLTVTPPADLAAGNYTITAYARRGGEKFSMSLAPLPTMPTILWREPAQTVVHAFDINVPAHLRVAYISAEGEMIPEALKRLGIPVEMLDPNALAFGDLSRFKAIVVGVRAYELRPELPSANKRLLDYVSAGGTLVVQYNRDFVWNKFLPAPYRATIGNPTPRTTDENAEVKFLKPDDPLLNWPNKITANDFQGWVQERGLYYWSDFDSKYTPLLSMHDPGEKDINGSLVYTRLGKGLYIYTGLAFFRQLPEGVPGAYRLFVNLLAPARYP